VITISKDHKCEVGPTVPEEEAEQEESMPEITIPLECHITFGEELTNATITHTRWASV
jgi:hypothetical protein